MPALQRALVAVLATLPVWTACKISERLGKRSDTKNETSVTEPTPLPLPTDEVVVLRDVPYLVHLRILLEGETPVTTLNEVKGTFVNACMSCHGPGTVLDLSTYPFKGRFATPAATVQEIIHRVKSAAAPMPPVPAAPLTPEAVQALEDWLKDGLPLSQPARASPVFAQGLVLTTRHRVSGTVDWTEASLPWNGSGDFPGFFRQLAPGQALDVVINATGEDGKELASQSLQALSLPATGNLDFSLSVEEKAIKVHASDKDPAAPGNGGVAAAFDVLETSFTVHWEPAVDLLTPAAELQYSVYVSERNGFTAVEAVPLTGTKVTDFAAYQEAIPVSGLAPGKTYFVAILVKDRGGNVSLYQVLQQSTAADKAPPTPPSPAKITISQLSDVAVTLSWKAATDNLTAADQLSYQVFASFRDDLGDAASLEQAAKTSVDLKGLVPETSYYFNVVVKDAAGNHATYDRVEVKSRAGSGSIGTLSYGRQCAERLGELRPFSCLDGKLIPIVIDGVEVPTGMTALQAQAYQFGTGTNQMKCDKPALLGLGEQGHCVPYSRVGRLKTYRKDGTEHPNVDTMFTCRRYQTRLGPQTYQGQTYDGADLPLFEDIAVIQHDRVTGETCWYQMLKPGYASADGRRVPPPTEAALPPGTPTHAQAATQFWLSPQSTADKKCFRCHDADPWMHSPYIDQVRDEAGRPFVPAGGFGGGRSGRYSMIGSRAFYKWDKSFAIASTVTTDTNGKSCTSCHNVGNVNDCQAWAKQASGQVLGPNLTATGQAFAHKFWMPPPDEQLLTEADWQASGYKRAAERLAACCANPDQAGCSKTPIMTPPPPFAAP